MKTLIKFVFLIQLATHNIGRAATSVVETFDGTTVSHLLVVPSGYRFGANATPPGTIQNATPLSYRPVVTTAATDFNKVDFVYEISFALGPGGPGEGAFIGIGGNVSDTGFPEPNTSAYLRIFPPEFGAQIDLSISRTPSDWDPPTFLSEVGEIPLGRHRVQIKKEDAKITFSCMTNDHGQPFSANYSITKSISADFPFLSDANSRLFFGAQTGGTSFDDLNLRIGCTPHRAQADALLVNGFVVGATLNESGCGYTNAPLVLIRGGGGQGATATASIVDGKVTGIQIVSAGCCYTSAPRIEIASPPFVPRVNISVSKVNVTQTVVLGWRYVLETSPDGASWTATGPPFIAESESVVTEFPAANPHQQFRLRVVP